MARRLVSRTATVALGFVLAAGACSKMPLVAPSGTVITLLSETNAVPVNGSAEITAVLIENGQQPSTGTGNQQAATGTAGAGTPVHNGTLVSFTTSLGRIEPAEARTTAGKAVVRLIANGQSGVATVTAFSGGASQKVTVNVGSAAAAHILVTANPQALPSTGGTSTISARVEDAQGNGIAGVPVSFSTTAGTLASGTSLTDSSGVATTLISTTAAATVTASAGGGTGTTGAALTATVALTVNANIALGLSPQTGTVTASTPMTFTVSVGATPVLTDVKVNFGDGESVDLGAISANQTVPHIYGSPGSYNASATATAADGSSKTVNAPVIVSDWSVTLTSSGNGAFGTTSTFTATVAPSGVSIAEYVFDFGDGDVVRTSSNQISHTFQSRGTKTVRVTAIPTKGASKSAVTQLEIS